MKILNVSKIVYFFVETDETDMNKYRRNVDGNRDCWERLMGDSWESWSADELEDLLQMWLSANDI